MKVYDNTGLVKRTVTTMSQVLFDSPVSDVLVVASVDDYAPPGWNYLSDRIHVTPASGGSIIKGLTVAGHLDGSAIILLNDALTVADNLQLDPEAGTSLATSRFTLAASESVILAPGDAVLLLRAGVRWRVTRW